MVAPSLNLYWVKFPGCKSRCSSPNALPSLCSVLSGVEVGWLSSSMDCLAAFSSIGVGYKDADALSPMLGKGIMPKNLF